MAPDPDQFDPPYRFLCPLDTSRESGDQDLYSFVTCVDGKTRNAATFMSVQAAEEEPSMMSTAGPPAADADLAQ